MMDGLGLDGVDTGETKRNMVAKKPNLFLIGAPKCGTTSLASWLAAHPQVFFSPIKEPHFFSTDLETRRVFGGKEYNKLFIGADAGHAIVAEGSTNYLYSQSAVRNIEQYTRQARYIVCLRPPDEMAVSLHSHNLFSGNEHIRDFAEAWRLSSERRVGRRVRFWCREPRNLDYERVCKLGEQVERLLNTVGTDRFLPVLLEDLVNDPAESAKRILSFLGIDQSFALSLPHLNRAKERGSQSIQNVVQVASLVKRRIGVKKEFGFATKIGRANTRRRAPVQPSPTFRSELRGMVVDEVSKLSSLIGRDLSHWTETASAELPGPAAASRKTGGQSSPPVGVVDQIS